MSWERARSEEQIEYRINEILEATAKLYEENRFEEVTTQLSNGMKGFPSNAFWSASITFKLFFLTVEM